MRSYDRELYSKAASKKSTQNMVRRKKAAAVSHPSKGLAALLDRLGEDWKWRWLTEEEARVVGASVDRRRSIGESQCGPRSRE
jgi:hypothetical protein